MMSYEDIIENLTEQINALTAENNLLRAQNEQIRQTHYSREAVEAMMKERGEVVRGGWVYAISKGSCMDWHVTAKCSECGWDWFSKEGIGNPGHVFGAFITNGDSKPDETKAFLLENAKSNNSLRFCPNCGAKMESEGGT